MSHTKISVNPRIFPLTLVKNALYVLSDRIDGRLDEAGNGRIDVTLTSIAEEMTAEEMGRIFNQALIAANANERAFQMAAPIRNYLAQSAFSVTSQNQQTIQEFIASVVGERNEEHAGAPVCHVDATSSEDDPFTPTENDNGVLVNVEKGQVIVRINTHKYLLPDVLQAAYETRGICDCAISYLPNNQLGVELNPCQDGVDLDTLGATFEHWLEVAVERWL